MENSMIQIDCKDEQLLKILKLWPDLAPFLRELFVDLACADVLDDPFPTPTREALRQSIMPILHEAIHTYCEENFE